MVTRKSITENERKETTAGRTAAAMLCHVATKEFLTDSHTGSSQKFQRNTTTKDCTGRGGRGWRMILLWYLIKMSSSGKVVLKWNPYSFKPHVLYATYLLLPKETGSEYISTDEMRFIHPRYLDGWEESSLSTVKRCIRDYYRYKYISFKIL